MTIENHEAFNQAADHIETFGWIRGDFENSRTGAACLLGGIRAAYAKDAHMLRWRDKQFELSLEIHKVLKLYPVYRCIYELEAKENPDASPGEWAFEAIQGWNDLPWRRKEKVIEVLRKAAKNSKNEWYASEIDRLNGIINKLEDKVTHLQDKVAQSDREVSRLQRLLGYKKATEEEVKELQSLSDELDQRWAELNALAR